MNLNILYKTNRTRFIANLKSKVNSVSNSIALFKGSYRFHHYDTTNHYNHKYDQNFVYLFGIQEFGFDGFIDLANDQSYLIKNTEKTDGLILGFNENLSDSVYKRLIDKSHKKAELTDQEAQDRYGIHAILTHTQFLEFLEKLNPQKIFINHGIDRYTGIKSNSYDDSTVLEKYKDVIDKDTSYPVLNNTRTIKSPEEVEFMRAICKISAQGHVEMMKNCEVGMTEYQIAAIFYVL